MGNRVSSTPAPGVRSLNDIPGNGQNIDLVSSDGSVTITPDSGNREIDLVVASGGAASGLVIENVPCDATVYVNAAVRMNSGTLINAVADSLANSNVLGFVEAKPTATTANIRLLGVTGAIFTGLDETKEYFLSAAVAGGITVTAPAGSGNVVYKLGQPYSATQFVVVKGDRFVRA